MVRADYASQVEVRPAMTPSCRARSSAYCNLAYFAFTTLDLFRHLGMPSVLFLRSPPLLPRMALLLSPDHLGVRTD